MLFVSKEDEEKIHDFFINNYNIKRNKLFKNLHLTVYYSRRLLLENPIFQNEIKINCDVHETRFMTMTPGGENQRLNNLMHWEKKIGIRLTKRNNAISDILELRKKCIINEPKFNKRKNTTLWYNSFGSRHFQAHISLLRANNGLYDNLFEVGKKFREEIKTISFSNIEIIIRKP